MAGFAVAADRIDHISQNLWFARDATRDLSQLIADAQKDGSAINHLAQRVGSILASARECFDYCARDICDDFVPSHRGRAYYPFRRQSLDPGQVFNQLARTAGPVFNELLRVARDIESGRALPNAVGRYSDASALNELVNQKKHDRILPISEIGRSRSRIEFPDGSVVTASPIYPIMDDGVPDFSKPGAVGPDQWTSNPRIKITAVKDFFLDAQGISMTRRDLPGFCLTAIAATQIILGEVYAAAYGKPLGLFFE